MTRTADESKSRAGSPGARREARAGGLATYFTRHFQALFFTLGRLYRAPLSSSMTVLVLGIALALPAGLHVLVNNTRDLSGAWEGAARISVFLKQNVPQTQAESLADSWRRRQDVADIAVISAADALAEFRTLSGFGDVLDVLDENPLPAVLVIRPRNTEAAAVAALADELRRLPAADIVQLDTQWLKRLNAILDIVRRVIFVVGALFAVAVIVIISNTIRLDIQNHRPEIEVTKLVGATNAFIRRPFLYTGFWYGLGGGLTAWLLVSASLWLLAGPVRNLAGLYGSEFSLSGLSGADTLIVLGTGSLLGWLGSWVAVTRHLGEIEPT